jgi:hypothetical protein
MPPKPNYRGQGNQRFEIAVPEGPIQRGQTAAYDLNGAPTGAAGAAEDVTFTPAGNVAAVNVQAAIEELDSEKVASSALTELVQDIMGALLGDNTGLNWTYNDGANTFTLEIDTAALRTLLDVWVNTAGDTMTGALAIAATLAGSPHISIEETGASGTGGAVSRLIGPKPTGNHRITVQQFGARDSNGVFQATAAITANAATDFGTLATEETYIGIEITLEGEFSRTEVLRLQNKGFTLVQAICLPIRTITATTTALKTDHTLLCDATAGAITVNLPAAAGCAGRIYNIKKIDASANAVTLDGNSSETIDGAATKATTTQYASFTIQSEGAAWHVL